jgi:flagellar hook-basal body complex protein FliE
MVAPIFGPGPVLTPDRPAQVGETKKSEGLDFANVLTSALSEATRAEKAATESAQNFANGEGGIHEVMIAQEKASISVRYAVTLKNKALEAYRELMNTPI